MAKEDLEDLGNPGTTRWRGSTEHRDDVDRLWKDCWWQGSVEKLCRRPMCFQNTWKD